MTIGNENKDNKQRFSVFIHTETYNRAKQFVESNDLIMERLTLASMMEMALNLFFKEVESRNLESVASEYLLNYKADKIPVGVDNE